MNFSFPRLLLLLGLGGLSLPGVLLANEWEFDQDVSPAVLERREKSADKVQVSTPRYEPDFTRFEPRLGTYTYEVRWQGITAATATISVDRMGTAFELVASAKTASGIDPLFKLRYRAEGLVAAKNLQPIRTFIDHRENSKVRFTTVRFGPGGFIDSYRERRGKNGHRLQFQTENPILDPFSAAFLARSLPWQIGETRSFDTFNGKSRYLIRLTATEKRIISVQGRPREVFVIVPEVSNLTSPKDNQKLRRARIFLTTDSLREIPRIESEVFVGRVSLDLVSFKPHPPPADLSVIALRQ